ncbi:MAG: hypothetical protein IIC78_01115 [Chloroflexi bacterium]|nr:hypothetical protein [Chloroflexota bacterium]
MNLFTALPDVTVQLDIVRQPVVYAEWSNEGETSLTGYESSVIRLDHTPGE